MAAEFNKLYPRKRKGMSLREIAQQRLNQGEVDLSGVDFQATETLVEELEIHRAELTVQNEELQAAYHQLETARDRYKSLFEQAPVGYLTVDDRGRIVEANGAAGELLGAMPERLVGRSLSEFVHPEHQDTLYLHRRALATGAQRRSDELVLGTEGEDLGHVQITSVPEAESVAQGPRFRCSLVNITELKAAQHALQQERDQLDQRVAERTRELDELRHHREQLLASLGKGVLGLDTRGYFTFLNTYAAQALGAAIPEELIGRDSHALLHPEPGACDGDTACPILQVLATGESCGPWRGWFAGADGREFSVEAYANPVWENDSLTGAVVMFTDTSERLACLNRLSAREGQVLELLTRGLTNKQAAKELAISHRTVEVHRAHLMDKLGVESFAELMRLVHHA